MQCMFPLVALSDSNDAFSVAFGGKADMPFCAAYVCFDPKRTCLKRANLNYGLVPECRGHNEAARVHHASRQCGDVPACGACAITRSAATSCLADGLS